MLITWDLVIASLAIALGCIVAWKKRAAFSCLPPGPPADILIGHARILPVSTAWEVYAKWKQTYGDVIYAHAFGRSIVILNSVTAARDVLEHKSSSFSDRPHSPIFYLMGWEFNLPLLRYGPRFRKQRRMMHQHFGSHVVASFRPIQENEIRKFLRHLLKTPDDFIDHIHTFVAGTVALIAYGHEVDSRNDTYVELVEHAVQMTARLSNVGTSIIDVFPFLCYVPAWFPGMGTKRLALKTHELVKKTMTFPFEELKAKRASGSAPTCLVSDLLDKYEEMNVVDREHEEDIKNIGAAIYNAGADTTKSALTSFFLLMALHPEVVKRAQEEIDEIIGKERLPSIDDRQRLPYVDCILKELYRIHPPLPLGVPHASTQTEYYRGWTIPDGTIAIPNIWQMMRDETSFPNPGIFRPERHLDKEKINLDQAPTPECFGVNPIPDSQNDPSNIVFGFGRRVCPGKHFADSSLWMAIASTLALFDIGPYTNAKTGKAKLPEIECETSALMM